MLLLCCAACGSKDIPGRRPVHPVEGKVSWQNQPPVGALVVFHPLDGSAPGDWPTGYPHGTVRSDGVFALSTYGHEDGAPAGEYAVTVQWHTSTSMEEEDSGGDRWQGRFSDPKTSGHRRRVQEGANFLEPIVLK
jgi:hypothetical protein